MRKVVVLSLTLGTALWVSTANLGCAGSASQLIVTEAQPPVAAAHPPAAPPPAAEQPPVAAAQPPATAHSPATPQPLATPQPPASPQPLATAQPPAAAPAAASCIAGCDSASLSPEGRANCHVQCKRLAQQPASVAAAPQPDLARQRAQCQSQCDAEANPGDRATCRLQCDQLASPPPAAATPGGTTHSFAPGGGQVPASPQAQQIAACQATCDHDASATDRATCRNNCGAVGTTVGPAASSQYVLGPAPTTSDADQRAAVIRGSSGIVQTTLPTAPAAPQPVNPQCAAHAQSCALACASAQSSCVAQCDQGKMSAADRATCKLTCGSSGGICRDDCRTKEAACKPVTY